MPSWYGAQLKKKKHKDLFTFTASNNMANAQLVRCKQH